MAQAAGLSVGGAAAPPISEGDLARQALAFPAQDPAVARAIKDMSEAPVQQFGIGTSIAVTTAVLIVVTTHVRIERDKDGKWSVPIEHRAAAPPPQAPSRETRPVPGTVVRGEGRPGLPLSGRSCRPRGA